MNSEKKVLNFYQIEFSPNRLDQFFMKICPLNLKIWNEYGFVLGPIQNWTNPRRIKRFVESIKFKEGVKLFLLILLWTLSGFQNHLMVIQEKKKKKKKIGWKEKTMIVNFLFGAISSFFNSGTQLFLPF